MKHRAIAFLAAAAALVVLAGCLTINVYFPEKAIKDLSQQIEEQVQKEAAAKAADGTQTPPPEAPAPKESNGGGVSLLDLLLGVSPAYAEVAAPEVTSPAIRKIIDSRAARLAALDAYKAKEVIGENNHGLVEARGLETLSDLKARADVQRVIKGENTDREQLYKEIAAAKNVDLSQLDKIRETYAATLRDNARSGDWIQSPDGSWKKK